MRDPSVAKVVYFGIINTCQTEISFNCSSNITNQQRSSIFGQKQEIGSRLRTNIQIALDCSFGGFIERDRSRFSAFLSGDEKFAHFAAVYECHILDANIR